MIMRDYLVGVAGFEPATPSSRTKCATKLRHTPINGRYYTHWRRFCYPFPGLEFKNSVVDCPDR